MSVRARSGVFLLAILAAVAALTPVSPAGAQDACTIEGSAAADTLVGTPGPDVICGLGGDDHLIGGEGNDILRGAEGNDILEAGGGVDFLFGGPGIDLMYGGPGDDELAGDADMDYLDGGEGVDRTDGGLGSDTCVLTVGDAQISCIRASPFDANDSNGGADVQRMLIGFSSGQPTWSFVMFNTFTTKGIRDHATYLVFLDTAGDLDAEFYALMRSNGSRMLAELYRVREDAVHDELVGPIDASKPNGNTVKVSVPRSRLELGVGRNFLRWYGQTLWVGDACPNVCFDRVPAADWLIRPLL